MSVKRRGEETLARGRDLVRSDRITRHSSVREMQCTCEGLPGSTGGERVDALQRSQENKPSEMKLRCMCECYARVFAGFEIAVRGRL